MLAMLLTRPVWLCDICHFQMPESHGEALWNRPSGTRHYPAPLLVCGDACAAVAETQLAAGDGAGGLPA